VAAINRTFFFEQIRQHLFEGKLKQSQVDGFAVLLDYWTAHHAAKDDRWLAYALATVHHETGRTMRPIHEWGGDDYFFANYDPKGSRPHVAKRLGNTEPGDGVLFHGRGYVQLTGRSNYRYWADKLSLPLTTEPDRVLEPAIAVRILFEGMILGTFTTKRFADYFGGVTAEWAHARRIINGNDKAEDIAGFARRYYAAISYTD